MKQRVVLEQQKEGMSMNDRSFKTIQKSGSFDTVIKIRTRLEPLTVAVPKNLYSPIWYQFYHQIIGSCKENFLVCKCVVREECGKKDLIKIAGDDSSILNKSKSGPALEGISKIKIQDSSFHHQRHAFVLEFAYYYNYDTQNPILVKQSPSFHVYSRKPKKKKNKTKSPLGKRKRNEKKNDQEQQNIFQSYLTPFITNFARKGQTDQLQNHLSAKPPLKIRKITMKHTVSNVSVNDGDGKMLKGDINIEFKRKINEFCGYTDSLPSVELRRSFLANSLQVIINMYQNTL